MNRNIKSYWAWGVVAILSVVLIYLCFQLVRVYRHNARAETISTERSTFTTLLSHHAPLTTANTAYIQSWMTFDYINTIFKLPPAYLQTALGITDAHYPHISLTRYAHTNKIDTNTFLTEVENTVASSTPIAQ